MTIQVYKLLSIYVFSYSPFGFEGRMWDVIVSVPNHCLSLYFTDKPTYLSGLTNLPTYKPINLSGLTDKPRYQPIYPGWLTDQHIWLQVYWQTSILTYLSGLTNLPTNKPILWVDWLAYLFRWLTIYMGWLYDHHTSLSIPDYLSELTVRPLYKPIYQGWLYDQHSWLYIRVDLPTNKPANLSWLTNRPTNQPTLSNRDHWPTNTPDYLSRLTDQRTYRPAVFTFVDWLINIPA